jgi:NAD-dependent deacetylase
VEQAHAVGARTVELNLEPSAGHSFFDEYYHGLASVMIPAFFTRVLEESV